MVGTELHEGGIAMAIQEGKAAHDFTLMAKAETHPDAVLAALESAT
jgi:hypothetical protein